MIEILIKKNNVVTHLSKKNNMSEAEAWVNSVAASGTFGQGYTVEYNDISTQLQAEQESKEALAYLASTDWLVVRKAETGVDYSQEIKNLRAAARLKVL